MTEKNNEKIVFFIISLFLLAMGLTGNFLSFNRPGLPFKVKSINNQLVVTEIDSQALAAIQKSTILKQISGIPVRHKWEVDFIVDNHTVGDSLILSMQHRDQIISTKIALIKQYANSSINYFLIILGILFWGIGVFVFINKSTDWAARVFAFGCLSLILTTLINWPGGPTQIPPLEYPLIILYWFFYPLIPCFILYFSLLYPQKKGILKQYKNLPVHFFRFGFLFIILLEVTYLFAFATKDLRAYSIFYNIYNYGFRILFIVYLATSIGNLVHSYLVAETKEDRNRVLWILWGLSIGTLPFLFLWTVPYTFFSQPLVPETVIYSFMMFIPIAFAISIIRYQALNIETIIRHSVVYVLVPGFIVTGITIFFVTSQISLTRIISQNTTYFLLGTGAFLILLLPLFSLIRGLVDKYLFQKRDTFRRIQKKYKNALQNIHSESETGKIIIHRIVQAIPIPKAAVVWKQTNSSEFSVIYSIGFTEQECRTIETRSLEQVKSFPFQENIPFVNMLSNNKIDEKEIPDSRFTSQIFFFPQIIGRQIWKMLLPHTNERFAELPEKDFFTNLKISLVIPCFVQNALLGLLILGEKTSENRFTIKELEFLSQMAVNGFMALERLRHQESMILEQAEKQKLAQLNELKSEFISHVSHELRTPLTTISWSVENLLDGIPEEPTPKIREYLTGISENTRQLERMIENLLDISRIEANRIEANPTDLELRHEIPKSISLLQPQADSKKIKFILPENLNYQVKADPDGLQTILTNLLSNAIKYSPPETSISLNVTLPENGETVEISIKDQGLGIAPEKIPHIFERFERVKTDKTIREKGLGLGLYITQKWIEIQGGRIRVESEEGKGSNFIFQLPGAESTKKISEYPLN